jgi:hypothetical protein
VSAAVSEGAGGGVEATTNAARAAAKMPALAEGAGWPDVAAFVPALATAFGPELGDGLACGGPDPRTNE